MASQHNTGTHPFLMTSQHNTGTHPFLWQQDNTGTHPFYIGMYIHICTHIYVHIYIYFSEGMFMYFFTWDCQPLWTSKTNSPPKDSALCPEFEWCLLWHIVFSLAGRPAAEHRHLLRVLIEPFWSNSSVAKLRYLPVPPKPKSLMFKAHMYMYKLPNHGNFLQERQQKGSQNELLPVNVINSITHTLLFHIQEHTSPMIKI